MSINSIARYFPIAKTAVRRRIDKISQTIAPHGLPETNQIYKVQTYMGNRNCHVNITYVISRDRKTIAEFVLVSRTK